jgi:hypothetical protein
VGLSKTKNPVEVTCMNCRRSSKWDKAIKKYQAEKEKPDVHVAIPPTPKSPVIRVPKIHLSRKGSTYGVVCNFFLMPSARTDNVAKVTCENCKRTNAYKNAAMGLKAKFEETKLAMEQERAMEPKEQKLRTLISMNQDEFNRYTKFHSIEEAKDGSEFDSATCVILEVVTTGKMKMIWDE